MATASESDPAALSSTQDLMARISQDTGSERGSLGIAALNNPPSP